MSISELLMQGLQLMLTGMGFVFAFLGLLIAIVLLMARLLYSPPVQMSVTEPALETDLMFDLERISAISVAIHHYRQQRRHVGDA